MTGPTFRQRWFDAIRDSEDSELDPIALAVAAGLDRYMDSEGRTYAGQKKIARRAKLRSTTTVVARVAVLERTGWLEVDRPEISGGRTHYRATIPDRHTGRDGSDRPMGRDGCQRQPSHATAATVSPRVPEPEEPEGKTRAEREPRGTVTVPATLRDRFATLVAAAPERLRPDELDQTYAALEAELGRGRLEAALDAAGGERFAWPREAAERLRRLAPPAAARPTPTPCHTPGCNGWWHLGEAGTAHPCPHQPTQTELDTTPRSESR